MKINSPIGRLVRSKRQAQGPQLPIPSSVTLGKCHGSIDAADIVPKPRGYSSTLVLGGAAASANVERTIVRTESVQPPHGRNSKGSTDVPRGETLVFSLLDFALGARCVPVAVRTQRQAVIEPAVGVGG